jgi:hypothetical protein
MSILKRLKEKVTPPDVDVSISLDKNAFALGEDVEGTLSVQSKEEFDADEIRCELECWERVRRFRRVYDASLKRDVEREFWESAKLFSARPQLCGPIHVFQGFSQSFRFKIPLPVGVSPTSKSIDRVVTWNFKGVVATKNRPDATSKTMELQVYPAAQPPPPPTVAMSTCKYCGTRFPATEVKCPHCGAPRTA